MEFCRNFHQYHGISRCLRLLSILICFVVGGAVSQAQQEPISGVINYYAGVEWIETNKCCSRLTIDVQPANRPFAVNDRVLIIQMKGATYKTLNGNQFGSITDYHTAGNYEFATISAVNGTTIDLANRLQRVYHTAGRVQLVYVPRYLNGAIVTGTVTAPAWNGTIGGIVVFEAPGQTVTLNADIDVSAKGFRGGAISNPAQNGYQCQNISANYTFSANHTPLGMGAYKGEGIGGLTSDVNVSGDALGRGALTNGGGGGNNHNSGGGGGNYSVGGNGGDVFSGCGSQPYGGIGGYSLTAGYSQNKLFLGGGGGGGHEGHFQGTGHNATPGGAGGGIVIIKAGTLGVGSNNQATIRADGESALSSLVDGAGGGGAGGTIYLDIAFFSSALTVEARGGNGGDVDNDGTDGWLHGPGGGGGCGALIVSGGTVDSNLNTAGITGGNNGVNTNYGNRPDLEPDHGATGGATGCNAVTGVQLAEAAPCCSELPTVTVEEYIGEYGEPNECCYTVTVSDPAGLGCNIAAIRYTVVPEQEVITAPVVGYPHTQLICITGNNPGSSDIEIEFLDADSRVLCVVSEDVFCPIQCCELINETLTVVNADGDHCCYTLSGTLPDCPITDIRIVRPAPAPAITFQPNNGAFTYDFCIASTVPGNQDIVVEYLDANGGIICSSTFPVLCGPLPCCDLLVPEVVQTSAPSVDECCFSFSVDMSAVAGTACDEISSVQISTVDYPSVMIDNGSGIIFGRSGSTITGTFCLKGTGAPMTLDISYRRSMGELQVEVCSMALNLSCEPEPECCNQIVPEFLSVPSVRPDECCFAFTTDLSGMAGLDCDEIQNAEITPADPAVTINGGASLVLQRSGTAIEGSFCLRGAGSPVTVIIAYKDQSGKVICTKSAELTCEPCDCGAEAFDIRFYSVEAEVDECCWSMDIINAESGCPIKGIEVVMNGVTVFAQPDLAGGPIYGGQSRTALGEFCTGSFPAKQTVTVRYFGMDGSLICETQEEVSCLCNCTSPPWGELRARVDRVVDPQSNECCYDLYIENYGDCDIWTQGIFTRYGDATTPEGVIGITDGEWDGDYLAGYDSGNDNYLWWRNTAIDNVFRRGSEIYLGRICVEPGTSPINLHFAVITDIDPQNPSGGFAHCPFGDTLLDCSEIDCCEGITITDHRTSSGEQCCGYFTVAYDSTICDLDSVAIFIFNQPVPGMWDPSLPGYRVNYCLQAGSGYLVNVKGYSNGHQVCSKSVYIECPDVVTWPKGGGEPEAQPDGSAFARLSAMPNPASDELTAQYYLPISGTVRLELYNTRGESLMVLHDGYQNEGTHKVHVRTDALSSGMYLLQLTSNGNIVSIPVTISR